MNEKYKKTIIVISFFFLVLFILIQSIADNIAIRRADTTIDTLGYELADAQRRLTENREEIRDCRNTISECRGAVGRVHNSLERQSTELKDIIRNLETVREEVENMENALADFYGKYSYNDEYNYNNGSEVE